MSYCFALVSYGKVICCLGGVRFSTVSFGDSGANLGFVLCRVCIAGIILYRNAGGEVGSCLALWRYGNVLWCIVWQSNVVVE